MRQSDNLKMGYAESRKKYRLIVLLSYCLIISLLAAAQNKNIESQNQNIARAKKRLAEIEQLKAANTQSASTSERELTLARNEIGARREIVSELDNQTREISSEINADQRQVVQLNGRLGKLKSEYGEYVYAAWKTSKTANTLTFLLSSRDFDDATRRLSFLRRYNDVRAQKGAEIDSLALVLDEKIATLNENRAQLGELKTRSETELSTLAQKEQQYAATLENLARDRKKLESDAASERAKILAAQKQIDKIMAQLAAAEEKARAEREGRQRTYVVLSGKFEENKGRLSWPVGGPGAVLDKFGANRMPDGIVKNSKGITIATNNGARVHSVFEGTVSGVYKQPEFGMCVIVLTGGYMVLYANLAEILVAAGDKISVDQQVGRIADSNSSDSKKLMFQIWKGTTALDPQQWLAR